MFDPVFVDSVAKLGALGLAIIAVGAYAVDFVRPSKRADRDAAAEAARRDKREAELVTERNEWRIMAETAIGKVGRLTDVLEATVGKKLGE